MGTISPEELLNLWARENIPVEMAMGHVLQNLSKMQAKIRTMNNTLSDLQANLPHKARKDSTVKSRKSLT